jgi:hypothetical protein
MPNASLFTDETPISRFYKRNASLPRLATGPSPRSMAVGKRFYFAAAQDPEGSPRAKRTAITSDDDGPVERTTIHRSESDEASADRKAATQGNRMRFTETSAALRTTPNPTPST